MVKGSLSGVIGVILVTLDYLSVAEIKRAKYGSFFNQLANFRITRLRNPKQLLEQMSYSNLVLLDDELR